MLLPIGVLGRPVVAFVQSNGRIDAVRIEAGLPLAMAARRKHIPGFESDCRDGYCNGSCRVVIDPRFGRFLEPASDDEVNVLRIVGGRASGPRLACRIIVSDALDGLTVQIPARGPAAECAPVRTPLRKTS